MNSAQNRALEQKNTPPKIDQLPKDIQQDIIDFIGSKIGAKSFKVSDKIYDTIKVPSFFANLNVLIATQIAHNLVWQIDVEKTLELVAQHPQALLTTVDITDPHGQKIRAKPLQHVAATGDFNIKEMKPEEKNVGLVEQLKPYFKNPADYKNQLAAWFGKESKVETEKRMEPYVTAIKTLCKNIIESKDISESTPFEELLNLPIAQTFRKSLASNNNVIVTSGFLFDIAIFLDFFDIWAANDQRDDETTAYLGGPSSLKSQLFAAIVYPALQARSQRVNIGMFESGISIAQLREYRLDFAKNISDNLSGLGTSYFFNHTGRKIPCKERVKAGSWGPEWLWSPLGYCWSGIQTDFEKLRSNIITSLELALREQSQSETLRADSIHPTSGTLSS